MNKTQRKALALMAGAFLMAAALPSAAHADRRLGQDVASYQDSTLWWMQQRYALGSRFTIVKLGGSGGQEGAHYQNPKASAQLANAQASGQDIGAYYWGQFGADSNWARTMAHYAISDAQRVGLKKGSTIALDYEAGATNNVQANTRAIIAYMDTIKDAGYKPALYSGAWYLQHYVDIEQIGQRYGTCLWAASYITTANQTGPNFNYFPSMRYVALWQYADNWYGVDGNVELVDHFVRTGEVKEDTPVKPTQPDQSNRTGSTYTVQAGDSWWAIAQRVGLDMYQLAQLNGKTVNDVIHPGQVLNIKGTIKDGAAETKQPSSPATSNSAAKGGTSKAKQPATPKTWTDELGDTWHEEKGTFVSTTQLHLRWGARTTSAMVALLPAGSVIKYDAWSRHGGYVWLRQPRGGSEYAYIACRNAQTNEPYGTFK